TGRVQSLRTYVGGRWVAPRGDAAVTDLGTVASRDAVEFLLGLATQEDAGGGEEAILPLTLADSVTVWPLLLKLARDDRASSRPDVMEVVADARGRGRTPPTVTLRLLCLAPRRRTCGAHDDGGPDRAPTGARRQARRPRLARGQGRRRLHRDRSPGRELARGIDDRDDRVRRRRGVRGCAVVRRGACQDFATSRPPRRRYAERHVLRRL